ncbi:MAG: hypothetical protein H6925_02105 [Holosporaceae bacterium]|nr:MAG: hypothetical protein H6925_02105 [Holosporaceae bacterium]
MAHFRSIFYLIGWLIIILAVAMMPSVFLDFWDGVQDYRAYLFAQVVMIFLGVLFVFSNKSSTDIDFDKRDSFLLTTFSWLFAVGFSALPFMLSSVPLSLTDAFFESVSGLTTTGRPFWKSLINCLEGFCFGVRCCSGWEESESL